LVKAGYSVLIKPQCDRLAAMRGKYEICGVEAIVSDKDKDLKDYINSGNTCKVIHCLSPKELDGAEYYLSYLR